MSDKPQVNPITMTDGQERADRAASRLAVALGDEPGSADAAVLRAWAEVDALRARVAEMEAALADERKLADELAHSLMKEAAQTGEGCFFASTEVVIADHNARRAKEAAE